MTVHENKVQQERKNERARRRRDSVLNRHHSDQYISPPISGLLTQPYYFMLLTSPIYLQFNCFLTEHLLDLTS